MCEPNAHWRTYGNMGSFTNMVSVVTFTEKNAVLQFFSIAHIKQMPNGIVGAAQDSTLLNSEHNSFGLVSLKYKFLII